ncbi:MarR family winged helix-turn-helix transcriptional regulator [Vibrio mangrovi]|uniref:MarR family transcriptional regulator n=1 Tax=Vibrio mangrovi TaxID=474394 RepID=A0A1Y6IVK2_9VIBR|nr:MarR family transcriptional regulator [Vibrio mangrovi]MDW6004927.1 MarR family transcriptional regulator [Vibrio mangrovi]SMS01689.1 putative HTH-type transcriptional regulator YusO [Vibrio mangrovi]
MSSLIELNNLLTEFYDKMSSWELSVVKETGYSLAQIHTLEVLGSHGAMKMKDLANRLGITTGTLTVQIDKLVRLGLVARHFYEEDRRSILVDLTDSGIQIFRQHNQLHLSLTEELTKNLDTEAKSVLASVLMQINQEF